MPGRAQVFDYCSNAPTGPTDQAVNGEWQPTTFNFPCTEVSTAPYSTQRHQIHNHGVGKTCNSQPNSSPYTGITWDSYRRLPIKVHTNCVPNSTTFIELWGTTNHSCSANFCASSKFFEMMKLGILLHRDFRQYLHYSEIDFRVSNPEGARNCTNGVKSGVESTTKVHSNQCSGWGMRPKKCKFYEIFEYMYTMGISLARILRNFQGLWAVPRPILACQI